MTIASMDNLKAALPGQGFAVNKSSATAKAAATYQSLWTTAGMPGAGSAPGSVNGAIATSATTGALAFTNPTGGNITEIARAFCASTTVGTFILYDRVWHSSALAGNVNTLQTFTQPSLTRYTTGVGLELFAEVYTATGSTPATATALYKNQNGAASGQSATAAIVATPVAGQMFPFTLQAGDTGVTDVDSVQLSVSTGTAGDWGLTLMRRLVEIPVPLVSVGTQLDGFALSFPKVEDDACLAWMVFTSTTNTGNMIGSMNLIQG